MPTVYLSDSEKKFLEGLLEEELRDPTQGQDACRKIESILESVGEDQPSLIAPKKVKCAYEVMRDVTTEKAPFPFQDKKYIMPILEENKSVLSWVMSDASSETFGENLGVIVDYLDSEGYRVENMGHLLHDLKEHMVDEE